MEVGSYLFLAELTLACAHVGMSGLGQEEAELHELSATQVGGSRRSSRAWMRV
jgi:hypothetical protein